jgi:hypothetical protein
MENLRFSTCRSLEYLTDKRYSTVSAGKKQFIIRMNKNFLKQRLEKKLVAKALCN